jgi:hypothetical protein
MHLIDRLSIHRVVVVAVNWLAAVGSYLVSPKRHGRIRGTPRFAVDKQLWPPGTGSGWLRMIIWLALTGRGHSRPSECFGSALENTASD